MRAASIAARILEATTNPSPPLFIMWISITSDNLKQCITGPEYNAFTTAALNTSQDAGTLVADAIARTVAEIRGYVGASKVNTLGEDGTIPGELEDTALVLVICKIITRLPGLKRTLERFETMQDNAMKRLGDVAADRFAIVQPTTAAPSDEQPAVATIAVVRRPCRPTSRRSLGGLF